MIDYEKMARKKYYNSRTIYIYDFFSTRMILKF